jgi:hypothetical protein
MAKKKTAKKQKSVTRKVTKGHDPSPPTPSLNALVNALYEALHKDGLDAVIDVLDFELHIHKLELKDQKQRPGLLTTQQIMHLSEKKSAPKKKKKKK